MAGCGGKGAEKTTALENEWPFYIRASSIHIHIYIYNHQKFPASILLTTKLTVHVSLAFDFQMKVCLPDLWHLACANVKDRQLPSRGFLLVKKASSRKETGMSVSPSPRQHVSLPAQDAEQSTVLAAREHRQVSCHLVSYRSVTFLSRYFKQLLVQ